MKKIQVTILISSLILFMSTSVVRAAGAVQIYYNITFPEAQAHYADVEMKISGISQPAIELKMPVWTPGSYLVREFAKNVESFSATSGGKILSSTKVRKNAWKINTAGLSAITVKYRVYCFEISVRTSYIDVSHAFLSSTGIFMYPDKMLNLPSTVHIEPYKGWSIVSTSLEMVKGDAFTRHAPNYDILFDSPIEVGNQDVFGFDAAGVKYAVAMFGGGTYDKEKLKKDMAKIVETETAVFGENPNKHYVFLVHNHSRGGGGLEHLSGATLGASRESYATDAGYKGFLSLVAHEHFHLWNVKRLRPIVLGPFDYDNENYTTDLWVAEGFTSYYQDLILRHADLYDVATFLTAISGQINTVENQPGAKVQTLAESSYDAWIKAYRPNENSINTGISYYDKGAVIALLLDLDIINETKGKYSLDDVMRYMYNTYYKQKKRGYTDSEFKLGLEKFAGKKLDIFYSNFITGLTPLDLNKYLGYAGYKLTDEFADSNDPSLGIILNSNNGKKIISAVLRDGAAWKDGLNVNDEIITIDGNAVTDMPLSLANKKPGDVISVSVVRDGLPLTIPVTLLRNDHVKFKIDTVASPIAKQLEVRKKWLKL